MSSTAALRAAPVTTAQAVAPVAAAKPLTPLGIVSGVVSSVLGPLANNTPVAPAQPPALWAVLAWARREFERNPTETTTTTEDIGSFTIPVGESPTSGPSTITVPALTVERIGEVVTNESVQIVAPISDPGGHTWTIDASGTFATATASATEQPPGVVISIPVGGTQSGEQGTVTIAGPVIQSPAYPAPVSEFRFSENSGNAVSSIGGFTLAPAASSSWETGRIKGPLTGPLGPNANVDNWSIAFDLTVNQAWTGWLGFVGRSSPRLDITASAAGQIGIWLGGGNSIISGSGVLAPGNTYQVAYTHTGGTAANAVTKIYVNGTERASGSPGATTPAVNWGNSWMVGRITGNVPIGPSPQHAFMDNVRAWNVTLTPAQVAALAGQQPPVSSPAYPAPVSEFRFSENSGNAVSSIGGFTLVPAASSSWETGRIKGPLTGPLGPNANVDNWSIAFDLTVNQAWTGWLGFVGRSSPRLDITASAAGQIGIWLGGGNSIISGSGVLAPGNTYQVAYTHTGGTAANAVTKIYVNGTERASGSPGATTPAVNWGNSWMVGRITGNVPIGPSPQHAFMDNVRAWNVTLTPAQVAALAGQQPLPPPPPPGPTDTVFPFLPTAALKYGWGNPTVVDEFTVKPAYPNWHVYNGLGHAGNGTRTPNQVFVDPANGGVMSIIGTPQGASAGMAWRQNPAAAGVTGNGARYGRWEVAMKTPAGSEHYHPVMLLWNDAQQWPASEVDFVEIFKSGSRQSVEFFLHYAVNGVLDPPNGTGYDFGSVNKDATQWHAWAVELTPTKITAYVDGEPWFESTNTHKFPPSAMHLTLQLDNFSNQGSIAQGGRMDVAWVRYYPL